MLATVRGSVSRRQAVKDSLREKLFMRLWVLAVREPASPRGVVICEHTSLEVSAAGHSCLSGHACAPVHAMSLYSSCLRELVVSVHAALDGLLVLKGVSTAVFHRAVLL